MGPYNAGPNLTPAPLTPERIHSKDAIYQISKKDYFSKTCYSLFKMAIITPAPLTPAFINATRKNNADLGLALQRTKYGRNEHGAEKKKEYFLPLSFVSEH